VASDNRRAAPDKGLFLALVIRVSRLVCTAKLLASYIGLSKVAQDSPKGEVESDADNEAECGKFDMLPRLY
jgi:hypothetical protein